MVLKNILPLIPKPKAVVNRSVTRKVKREVVKFLPILMDPVNKFLDEINTEGHNYTYLDSFKFWSVKYADAVSMCLQMEKPKLTAIDPDYFYNYFKPLETWPKESNLKN